MRRTLCDIRIVAFVLVATCLSITACSAPSDVDVPLTLIPSPMVTVTEIAPTPEPPPPKTLIICLNQEPASLYLYSEDYLYGSANREASAVLQAIYDGPFDIVDYEVLPVILQRTPNLFSGEDAVLEEITILEDDVYLNPETLQPEALKKGKPYIPSGCESLDCIRTYQGGQVTMQRMVVDFHLYPDLTWSDGEPLTAADSVFSFELDRHADKLTTKYMIDRTFAYTALDEVAVRWIGIAGFFDTEYAINFWSPLPEHILGSYSPSELLTTEEANRRPIGWGPYVIQEWRTGGQILLQANPNYHRAAEGLPKFEFLIFRFLGSDVNSAVQQLLTGECDVLDESLIPEEALPVLLELQEAGNLKLAWTPGAEMERIDFNLAPVGPSAEEALFAEALTRRAIAGCIDRQRIVEEILLGLSIVPDTYISPAHPYHHDGLETIPYDVSTATALLEEIGWRDDDVSETPRVALGVPGVHDGTPLSFTYLTARGFFREAVAEQLQADLATCGVEVTVIVDDAHAIAAPWPEGLAFGRGFDVVGWPWPDWLSPLCEMFAGREIPSDDNPWGSNASAFDNAEYNLMCDTMLLGPAESQAYQEAVRITQEIFTLELPAIPLYLVPRVLAYSNEVCGVEIDPTSLNALWALEAYDAGEGCEK